MPRSKRKASFFLESKIAVPLRANFDHIWYEIASNGQIYIYIYINND